MSSSTYHAAQAPERGRRRLLWAPLTLFAVLATATLVVHEFNHYEETRARAEQRGLLSDQLARRLEDFIDARLSLLEVMRRGRAILMNDARSFGEYASELQREFGGFHAINWIDADGVIRWVSPYEANRSAVGRNVFEHDIAGPVLRSARDTRRPCITGPLQLFQGGYAVTAYYPEEDADGELTGYINGVFLIESLVESCLGDAVFESYDIEIHDGEDLVYSTQGATTEGRTGDDTAHAVLELLGRTWSLAITPRRDAPGSLATPFNSWILWGGLTLAFAVALALRLALAYADYERRAALKQADLEARLYRAQRLEALGQLTGGIAHDFNNMLTAILGNANLAAMCRDLEPFHRRALDQVVAASERAAALTRRLLTFSSQQLVQPELLHLNEEIRELRPMLERLVREDIRLTFELAADHDIVEMDPAQVSQVIMNLVVNSVDAMPDGGDLCIRTREVDESLNGEAGRWIALTVTDSGDGMDADTIERSLEPFFTTKPVGKGTGLGLSTVYGEVTLAGGELDIRSELGQGTVIELRLPLSSGDATYTPSGSSATSTVGQGLSGTTVLLVEDESSVLEVARRALESAGCHVVIAHDGSEALEIADRGTDFDVVVSDALMPNVGGVELICELHRRDPGLPAVIMSGYSEDLLSNASSELDAIMLTKPFVASSLVRAVERALQRNGVDSTR